MSSVSAETLPALFLERVKKTPDSDAFLAPAGKEWKTYSWKQTGDIVRQIAMGLRSLGLRNEERAAILAGTRLDWILADLGTLCAGGATTTIYPANTPDETAYILKDSGTRVVFAENDEQVKKLVQKRAELADVIKVVTFDGAASSDGWVITFEELKRLGQEEDKKDPSAYEKIVMSVPKTALATLIYTSGTTGQPKGVELLHDCWVFEAEGIEKMGIISFSDLQYLWLPLAHVFGKVLEAMQIKIGFATAVDGRVDKLVENLGVVRPTFVCGVPRIFEKVHNKVVQGAREGGGTKAKIFDWAVGVGHEVSKVSQAGGKPGGMLAIKNAIANKLVFSKIQARFGGRLRFFISGSAPLSREVAEFFHGAGILILEGYGMTESSAATCVNMPQKFKFGTVGPTIPGAQIKIAPEDGEILIKGRGVMRGYHNMPQATAETLTDDGWLRTGDIGEVDADGMIKITDRKKDLIKTSGGKYVAPQFLEGKFKALCPYVSQIVIHGDNRKFISALVTIDEESIRKWASENGLGGKSYAEISNAPQTKALVQGFIDTLNKELPSYETIKQIALLPEDLTIEKGELTASMKVRRKIVEKKYKAMLDALYEGGSAARDSAA
ncbi:MAG: AMP-dependent synthetase/ligase [Myxococcaceae bacterium]